MKPSKRYPWFLVFFISLIHCSTEVPINNPFDPNAPAAIQAPGTLRGKVFLEGGESLGGIRVDLAGPSHLSARTEGDGSYSFANLPSGTYSITATYTRSITN